MTISNNQLAKNFVTGQHPNVNDRNSNRMAIKEKENHTIIEGYGHALYAIKYRGTVIVFNDWRGYSQTTSKHLTQIKRKAELDNHVNLIEINNQFEQRELKGHKSTTTLKEVMCDYCKVQPTKKRNKQNGLRVCDKTKCNQRMAKGEDPRGEKQPVL